MSQWYPLCCALLMVNGNRFAPRTTEHLLLSITVSALEVDNLSHCIKALTLLHDMLDV